MSERGITQMIVSDPMSIFYLTGVYVQPFERLFCLYIPAQGTGTLFLNKLFNVSGSGLNEVWMSDTDDGVSMISDVIDSKLPLGIDKSWPAGFLIPLIEKNPGMRCVLASNCIDDARACKDEYECDKMREASKINDMCMDHMFFFIKAGMTELECADEVLRFYKENGSEGPSFPPIVSFGANAADPHHEPDGTALNVGDCIVLDIGCKKDGYCSDMTRTWFCQKTDPKYLEIHRVVNKAGAAAEAVIKPGVRFCDIDRTARDIICEAGYGEYFTHRLGHSIGLLEHECDDVSEANTKEVRPGNIFSIEPGIYLPGEMGVRIEDLVLVTEDGCELLNTRYRGFKYTS